MDGIDFIYDFRVVSLLLGILIPLLLYWYSIKNHDYWSKRNIPFVKPYPFIGTMLANFKQNFEDIELERYKKFGPIYGFFEGSKPMLAIGEPEHLKNILVKDFQYFTTRRIFETADPILDNMMTAAHGETWKRIRTIVSPTFSTGKIKRMLSIFEDCAKTLTQNFKMGLMKGEPIDVLKTYGAFTMDIIASSAFSTKIDSHNNPENEFVKRAKAAFSQNIGFRFIMFLVMPKIMKTLGIKAFDPAVMDFFKSATIEIINERKRTGQTRNDFLQLLMDTAKEVAKEEKLDDKSEDIMTNYGENSANDSVFKITTSKHLSMDELVAQCVIFFLAGYHTTATTLGLTTYSLALNPEVQDKVFEEIKEVLSETNGKLKYESINKMKYLDNVISEALRLYAPLIRLERTADADYKLGDTGITIPKGMTIGIPIYAMHRDPKLFPEPEKFNPDRFNTQEREKQIQYSYLPFGSGPRNCVGMRFALVELKVCLIYVFSAFIAKKCPETKIPLEFGKGTGLLQPKSIMLKMIPRDDCPLKP